MRAQPLAQLSGPLPMSDRLYPAGASPFCKVAAAARRKRDFRGAGFGRGCRTATMGAKRTQDAPAAEGAEQASSSGFSGLVNELLYGAASRLERGQATCRACKGTGTLECTACGGFGTVQPQKVRMNQLRHALNRIKALVGLDKKLYDTQWQKTNRCLKCRGAGRAPCVACEGLGVRAPRVSRTSPSRSRAQDT